MYTFKYLYQKRRKTSINSVNFYLNKLQRDQPFERGIKDLFEKEHNQMSDKAMEDPQLSQSLGKCK